MCFLTKKSKNFEAKKEKILLFERNYYEKVQNYIDPYIISLKKKSHCGVYVKKIQKKHIRKLHYVVR